MPPGFDPAQDHGRLGRGDTHLRGIGDGFQFREFLSMADPSVREWAIDRVQRCEKDVQPNR
jgi:hypothetical protein